MRILHVLDHSLPLHSGYAFRTAAILRAQQAMGWHPIALTGPRQYSGLAREETSDGLHFLRTPHQQTWPLSLPGLREIDEILTTARRLRTLIPEELPDLIHAHSPLLNGWAAGMAIRNAPRPLVYEIRAFWEDAAVNHGSCREDGFRYLLTRSLEDRLMRRAHMIVTICDGLRQAIMERGIPSAKVHVVPNGVEPQLFETLPTHDPIPEWSDCMVLGFIGSFYAYEGLDLLVESLPLVLAHQPQTRLLLVGGGPEEDHLRQKVGQLGLSDRIRFCGRVPHQQVSAYYQRINLLLYPRHSMRLTELVTPLKPLEAMAQGKLVLASDVGGHRELIQNGHTGFLFPPDDPHALASAIIHLLSHRDLWSPVTHAARDWCRKQRTWSHLAAKYADVYEQARDRFLLGTQHA